VKGKDTRGFREEIFETRNRVASIISSATPSFQDAERGGRTRNGLALSCGIRGIMATRLRPGFYRHIANFRTTTIQRMDGAIGSLGFRFGVKKLFGKRTQICRIQAKGH
jgi:hypothetical protein